MIDRETNELVERGSSHFPSQVLDASAAKEVRSQIPQRLACVEHDDRFAAAPQYAKHLGDRAFGVWSVVQHAVAVDQIEGLRRERKVLCVGLSEDARQPFELESLTRQAQ